ncbi:alpha/beta fold hydrolase [Sandarakinorhabdus sp. DWP1-3-1]|uniref:alpha/beta fold hydrolase n=1 Tax=Sandarakinorhabdus sp. DWP1-3-1 TaxID=2804627 RepID=UPI003CF2F373
MPVLVLAGTDDRIVSQHGWEDPRSHTPNAVPIIGGGHFPWIENPSMVRDAFKHLELQVDRHAMQTT